MNIFDLNFCEDKDKWKRKLITIEVTKNDSDKVIDLVKYKNLCALI